MLPGKNKKGKLTSTDGVMEECTADRREL